MNANRKFKKMPRHDGPVLHALRQLYKRLQRIEIKLRSQQEDPLGQQLTYRDREYVLDRVGISDRTLLRFQKMGIIPLAKRIKGKAYYFDKDVEHFRRYYRGGI